MKKAMFVIILLINTFISSAQIEWSDWITLHDESAGSISISFKINTKESVCKGMGYSFFRIQNTFNETVDGKIYFDFLGCDGNISTETNKIFYEGPKIDQQLGMWFLGYSGQNAGVKNIRITGLKFPDREKAAADQKRADVEAKLKQEELQKTNAKQKEDDLHKEALEKQTNIENQQEIEKQKAAKKLKEEADKKAYEETIRKQKEEELKKNIAAKEERDKANKLRATELNAASAAVVTGLFASGLSSRGFSDN